MSRKYFGTDGVRGVANRDLTPQLAFSLGQGAGRWLVQTGQRRRVVIGRDTRKSGSMLGAALAAGFCSVGVEVTTLGVAPTPAVATVARIGDYGMGAIISASHNPAPDNGIKFVGHDGRKLPDEVEELIEGLFDADEPAPTGGEVGFIQANPAELEIYFNILIKIAGDGLKGMKLVVDCAHGAAYELAPRVLRHLGAEVEVIESEPDGLNINRHCGATHPDTIQNATIEHDADLGIAFDGDADRVIFSDRKGRLINGDRTIGLWAVAEQAAGRLSPPIVVGTVMTNGGLEAFLTTQGIKLERTPVGDKYVAKRINETSSRVGGEQSGHIIFPEHGPTGDGLATMLEFLRILKASGRTSEDLFDLYQPWPQVLVNMGVADRATWDRPDAVQNALRSAKELLGDHGRVNVRPSGTQPVVRVMVEASTSELRDEVCQMIVSAIEGESGGTVKSRVDLTHALGD
ncbi:MAG: phosphoglucosamine mutase [Armatimonadetes bacterium]|nr:phosphoglucosamine mutase [Armatimonadota bacterium]